jgi:hypothetical protein
VRCPYAIGTTLGVMYRVVKGRRVVDTPTPEKTTW